ncbi:hypothetical protein IC232_04675 [Microvirga sp. BT688]|uniref:hypothetical protein n=1 Tax=Microvirga sp. TaxID=1873136 RepID=UPI001685EC45|nr:hypothetical protein [Microvirga sp.]MBD2745990.1 hypothetical protein [Microvirga sp.]
MKVAKKDKEAYNEHIEMIRSSLTELMDRIDDLYDGLAALDGKVNAYSERSEDLRSTISESCSYLLKDRNWILASDAQAALLAKTDALYDEVKGALNRMFQETFAHEIAKGNPKYVNALLPASSQLS